VVSPPYLDAWREFTGGMAIELPPDAGEILKWFDTTKHTAVAAGDARP